MAYGCVNTPAAHLLRSSSSRPPRFACSGCGALSVPRKNFGSPPNAACSNATRSDGSFATGLQKFIGSPTTSSMLRNKWCAVIVPTTLGAHARTASRAAAVVQCSRTMRRVGNLACRRKKVGRKDSSAFRTVVSGEWLGGTSPWRFRTMSSSSIAAKTG